MDNPLLDRDALPQFTRIRPEHVEPAVREQLSENRARIGELATLAAPTFATVVEPLEELHHRIARTWSPVSHLNAVVNSEALRAGYNACLPLLSAYQTDLAQSEPLYRAYRTIAEQEGAVLGPAQRQVIEHAVRDFRLAGVGLPPERKERFKTAMLELAQLQAKFEENVLDATNAWSRHITDPDELRGLNEMLVDGKMMIHIKLHHGHDAPEIRDEPSEHASLVHRSQRSLRRIWREAGGQNFSKARLARAVDSLGRATKGSDCGVSPDRSMVFVIRAGGAVRSSCRGRWRCCCARRSWGRSPRDSSWRPG